MFYNIITDPKPLIFNDTILTMLKYLVNVFDIILHIILYLFCVYIYDKVYRRFVFNDYFRFLYVF